MKYLSKNISSEILATFWTNNLQDITYYDVLNFIDNQEKYYKNKMIIESFKDNEDNKKEEDRLEKSML